VSELQRQVHRMEGAALSRRLPVVPALADLLELRTGTTVAVGSATLAMALLAGPSSAGEWAAVVGVPDLGVEAAAELGVDLSRTILVPEPGEHWLSVTAGLVDTVGVVLVRPPAGVSEHEASRMSARLRQRDAVLLALGEWPRAQVRLSTVSTEWLGLGQGYGHLAGRRIQVTVRTTTAPTRTASVLLPAAEGLVPAEAAGGEDILAPAAHPTLTRAG
jgi:hypothetical protein